MVVCWARKRGSWRFPREHSRQAGQGGLCSSSRAPLEEDDVFLADFLLAEWREGLWRGQGGEVLGGRVSRAWAWSLAGEIWGWRGAVAAEPDRTQ